MIPETDYGALCRLAARDLRRRAACAARPSISRPSVCETDHIRPTSSTHAIQIPGRVRPSRDRSSQRVLAAARRAGIPVFYCARRPPPEPAEGNVSPARQQSPFPPTVTPSVAGSRRSRRRHHHQTACQHVPGFSALSSHVSLLGIRSLIVCRESTCGCLRASRVDAYSYSNSMCRWSRNTPSSTPAHPHQVDFFDLHHECVDFMHLDEVCARLDAMRMARAGRVMMHVKALPRIAEEARTRDCEWKKMPSSRSCLRKRHDL